MEQSDEKVMYDYADKFIDLANEISKEDKSGRVGMALRFAAARFSTYEASTQTDNLEQNKDSFLQLIIEDFTKMVRYNIEDYISILASKNTDA